MGLISRVSSRTYRKFKKHTVKMADQVKKRRTFKKFSYRGIDLDDLLNMSTEIHQHDQQSTPTISPTRFEKEALQLDCQIEQRETCRSGNHGTTKTSQNPSPRHHDPPTDGW